VAVLVRTHPQFLFAPRDRRLSVGLAQNALTTTGPLGIVPLEPPLPMPRLSTSDRALGSGRHRCTVQPRGRFVPPPGTTRHRAERDAVAGKGIWTVVFWQDTSERVVSTFSATLLSEWTANSLSTLFGVNLVTVDWKTSLGLAGGAALATLLKCLSASNVGDPTSASLLRRIRWTPPPGRHEKV
jgi:r1t holin